LGFPAEHAGAKAFYLPVVTKIDFFGRGYEALNEQRLSAAPTAVELRRENSLSSKEGTCLTTRQCIRGIRGPLLRAAAT
jgi:hypothetical protein